MLLAFKNLNSNVLENLSDDKLISWELKHEMIDKLDKIFTQLREKNINSLTYQESKCKYCYPNAPVYKFYDKKSGYVIGSYVITETDDQYIFEECKNNPIPDGEKGLPF